jgi:hypothetical protein
MARPRKTKIEKPKAKKRGRPKKSLTENKKNTVIHLWDTFDIKEKAFPLISMIIEFGTLKELGAKSQSEPQQYIKYKTQEQNLIMEIIKKIHQIFYSINNTP